MTLFGEDEDEDFGLLGDFTTGFLKFVDLATMPFDVEGTGLAM